MNIEKVKKTSEISNVEQLKEVLINISDKETTILDVFYYKKESIIDKNGKLSKHDKIVVVYMWDCLNVDYNVSSFRNIEDCINKFSKNKTELSEIKPINKSVHISEEF